MNTADKKESFWNKCKLFLTEALNKFFSFLRENAIIITLLLLYILFYRFWENLIGDHIIDKFLCHFESNGVSDSFFIVGVLICIFLFFLNRNKRIDQKTFVLCAIAIAFWVFYRFYHRFCGFDDSTRYYLYLKPLSFTKHVKYVDLISFYAICTLASPLLGKVINYIKEKINNNGEENVENVVNGFIRDVPIEDSAMDELDRERIAHTAIDKLLETETQNGAFTFGIDAPWGAGKTSFMNMMKQRLEQNKEHKQDKNLDLITIIDFNPWLFSEGKDLVATFFEVLSNNLKHYDKSLAKNIIDYSRLLSSFSTNETKLIASLFDLVKHDNTLKEKKNQIESTLKRIKRKIIVFIDDLDRLDAKEIMEMLKLIRSVSDFPFMYFIVAYDKSYIIQSIESAKLSNKATDFVEKIFQVELRLLETPKTDLSNKIYNLIYEHLKDEDKDLTWVELDTPFISSLTTLREIKRFANSFLLSYDSLEKARARELVFIELLKTKFPTFFSYFSNFWVSEWVNYRNDEDLIQLFIAKISDQNQREKLKLTDADITNIVDILGYIKELMKTSSNNKYIDSHERDLNNYLLPTKTKIALLEFSKLIENNDIQTIKKMLSLWMRTEHIKESLCNVLLLYEPINKDNYLKLIETLFITIGYGNLPVNLYSRITSSITELSLYKDNTKETDWNSDKEIIKENFIEYGQYSDSILEYLYDLAFEESKWEYPLTRYEINDIRGELFGYRLNAEWSNCREALRVFKLLADREIINDEKVSIYLPERKKEMREYAFSHMDTFIPEITIKSKEGNFYKLDGIVEDIWDSFSDFYDSFWSIDDETDSIIIEFKLLLVELDENNYEAVQIDDPVFNTGKLIKKIYKEYNN